MSKGIFRAIHGAAWLVVSSIALSGCGGITQAPTIEEFKEGAPKWGGSVETYAVNKPFAIVMKNLKATAPQCLYANSQSMYMGRLPAMHQTAQVFDLGPGQGRLEWRDSGQLGLVADITARGGGTDIKVYQTFTLGDVSRNINLWANGDTDCHRFW